jgi:hypothetical protein
MQGYFELGDSIHGLDYARLTIVAHEGRQTLPKRGKNAAERFALVPMPWSSGSLYFAVRGWVGQVLSTVVR